MQQLTDATLEFAITRFAEAAGHDATASTPCTDWSLGQLQDHTVGALSALADVLEGNDVDPARTDPTRNASGSGTDHVAALEAVAPRLSAIAADDAALDRSCSLRGMELPGRMVLTMALTDAAVHSWDVSEAVGSPASIPPEVAGPLLEFARHFADRARGRAFGAEVETDSADPSAQLVACLGRTP